MNTDFKTLKGTDCINFKFSYFEKNKLLRKAKEAGFYVLNDYLLFKLYSALKNPEKLQKPTKEKLKPVTVYLNPEAKAKVLLLAESENVTIKQILIGDL